MDLLELIRNFIYSTENTEIPENYENFRILNPEYSPHAAERKPYPLSPEHQLFALLWEQSGPHSLCATMLPREKPFLYRTEFPSDTRTQMHSHDYIELFYVASGEYRQKILGKEYTFRPGELCLIDQSCQHQEILSTGRTTVLFLGVSPSIFDSVMKLRIQSVHISSFAKIAALDRKSTQEFLHFHSRHASHGTIEPTLAALLYELSLWDEDSPQICRGLLRRTFHILSRQYEISLSQRQKIDAGWILFQEISEFIASHLDHVSLAMLSREFHFQDDYFNRLLKSQTGMTYTEYLQAMRLKKAESLLQNTDMRIEQIARAVGYSNKGYFYKIFTEQHRLTPAQFRKSFRE